MANLKILVIGATGMLGNAVLRYFSQSAGFTAFGTARSSRAILGLPASIRTNVISGIDIENSDSIVEVFRQTRPNVVINCVGLVKQLADASDPLAAIPINSLLPHRLARLCALVGARLVHPSTDCVFSGDKGMYTEDDTPDARDLYGRSKLLGEVNYPNSVTLRTSIIGHELNDPRSLIGWFLAQEGMVRGYSKAFFSGLPTVEIARIIRDFVIPNAALTGVYHVASTPICKHDLLTRVATEYGKTIEIESDTSVVLNRSLDSSRFNTATGYVAPTWKELIAEMRCFA